MIDQKGQSDGPHGIAQVINGVAGGIQEEPAGYPGVRRCAHKKILRSFLALWYAPLVLGQVSIQPRQMD